MVKKNHADNPEEFRKYNKQWRSKNPEHNKARLKKWRDSNRQHCLEYDHKRHKDHAEYEREYNQRRLVENRDRVLEIMRKSNAKRNGTLKGKLNNSMRSRINGSLHKGTKANRHWEQLVNFTIDQLKAHLEKLFKPGMTWENYGTVWEIDHKIPIAAFNFEAPEHIDFRLCWSLKNLQPLEALKNRSKGSKLEKPFQPSLAIGVK